MPNKTIHKEDGQKSVISTSDLHNDSLDVSNIHNAVSWNMSRMALNQQSLKNLTDRLGLHGSVLSAFIPNPSVQSGPDYREWIAARISTNKELKSVELLSQFKISINAVKKKLIEEKYQIFDIFINKNTLRAIFIVNEEEIINDEFINIFYDLAFKYEEEFRKTFKKEINLSFLGQEDIDYNELKIDKFFKLEDGK